MSAKNVNIVALGINIFLDKNFVLAVEHRKG